MKSIIKQIIGFAVLLGITASCADTNYPGGEVNPTIGIYDVRNLYKGSPGSLNVESLGGSNNISATVISDHSAGNIPEGLLIVQDAQRLDLLRGIAIPLGAQA
jgi:hypothetical protein